MAVQRDPNNPASWGKVGRNVLSDIVDGLRWAAARPVVEQCDVGDGWQVAALVGRWPGLRSVVHAAGVLGAVAAAVRRGPGRPRKTESVA